MSRRPEDEKTIQEVERELTKEVKTCSICAGIGIAPIPGLNAHRVSTICSRCDGHGRLVRTDRWSIWVPYSREKW